MTEAELIESGYVQVPVCIHISEEDETSSYGHRRLSYDLFNVDAEQKRVLTNFINKVNEHFPKIKMFITGGNFQMKTEQNETD